MEHAEFDAAFAQLPEGYSEGAYEGRRFGVTVRRSGDGRRNSLFARELAGTDIVSFNLYRVTTAVRLKREQIQLVVDGDVVGTGVAARKGLLQGHLLEKSD